MLDRDMLVSDQVVWGSLDCAVVVEGLCDTHILKGEVPELLRNFDTLRLHRNIALHRQNTNSTLCNSISMLVTRRGRFESVSKEVEALEELQRAVVLLCIHTHEAVNSWVRSLPFRMRM
jgi:hypothetical protein